jgi:hypothetical protein
MSTEKNPIGSKQPYARPVLEVIDLVADEVLGIGCKGAASPGASQPSCTQTPCSAAGS